MHIFIIFSILIFLVSCTSSNSHNNPIQIKDSSPQFLPEISLPSNLSGMYYGYAHKGCGGTEVYVHANIINDNNGGYIGNSKLGWGTNPISISRSERIDNFSDTFTIHPEAINTSQGIGYRVSSGSNRIGGWMYLVSINKYEDVMMVECESNGHLLMVKLKPIFTSDGIYGSAFSSSRPCEVLSRGHLDLRMAYQEALNGLSGLSLFNLGQLEYDSFTGNIAVNKMLGNGWRSGLNDHMLKNVLLELDRQMDICYYFLPYDSDVRTLNSNIHKYYTPKYFFDDRRGGKKAIYNSGVFPAKIDIWKGNYTGRVYAQRERVFRDTKPVPPNWLDAKDEPAQLARLWINDRDWLGGDGPYSVDNNLDIVALHKTLTPFISRIKKGIKSNKCTYNCDF